MTDVDLDKVETKVEQALDERIAEDPSSLEKYIVGSILEGFDQATREHPYDIDVTIPDDFTLTEGELGTAGRQLFIDVMTIRGEKFGLHIHDHDVDTSKKHRQF